MFNLSFFCGNRTNIKRCRPEFEVTVVIPAGWIIVPGVGFFLQQTTQTTTLTTHNTIRPTIPPMIAPMIVPTDLKRNKV